MDPFQTEIISRLLARYQRLGTFGNRLGFLPGWHDDFDFKDWERLYEVMPRFRIPLLLTLPLHYLSEHRPKRGFSLEIPRGGATQFHRSFNDLLIWEIILEAYQKEKLPEFVVDPLGKCLELTIKNSLHMNFLGKKIRVFSYFPQHDHLFNKRSPVFWGLKAMDISTGDNDATAVVMSSLIEMARYPVFNNYLESVDSHWVNEFMWVLSGHVYQQGKYGKGPLSYDNGLNPGDRGIVTWTGDMENEVDPCSNINFLSFFTAALSRFQQIEIQYYAPIFSGICGFLVEHLKSGHFFSSRFQMYYPIGTVFFFFDRFLRIWKKLNKEYQKILDSNDDVKTMEYYFFKKGGELIYSKDQVSNPNDRVLALPFFTGQNGKLPSGYRMVDLMADIKIFRKKVYESFHLNYPVKILCGSDMLPFACWLRAFSDLNRSK